MRREKDPRPAGTRGNPRVRGFYGGPSTFVNQAAGCRLHFRAINNVACRASTEEQRVFTPPAPRPSLLVVGHVGRVRRGCKGHLGARKSGRDGARGGKELIQGHEAAAGVTKARASGITVDAMRISWSRCRLHTRRQLRFALPSGRGVGEGTQKT